MVNEKFNLESIRKNTKTFRYKETNQFTQYNFLKFRDNNDYAQGPLFYIFMTAPQLNLNNDTIQSLPFLSTLNHEAAQYKGKSIIDSLREGGEQPFLKLLTNTCTSFTPLDIAAQTINHSETWTKLRNSYPGEDNDSRSAGTFSIEYEELNGTPIMKTHKAWYEYIQACRRGTISRSKTMHRARAMDYFSSLYYFLIGPDHEEIIFWSKYTGIVPTGLPYSAFEGKKGGGEPIKVTIPYSFIYKEEMDPEILIDFNATVAGDFDPGENLLKALSNFPGAIGGYSLTLFSGLLNSLPFFNIDTTVDILEKGRDKKGRNALPDVLRVGKSIDQGKYIEEVTDKIITTGGPEYAYIGREQRIPYNNPNSRSAINVPILVFGDNPPPKVVSR